MGNNLALPSADSQGTKINATQGDKVIGSLLRVQNNNTNTYISAGQKIESIAKYFTTVNNMSGYALTVSDKGGCGGAC